MTEADLARPVVVVTDFETKRLEYELYSYGEETVVVPVMGKRDDGPAKKIAAQAIENEFKRYSDQVKVDVVSDHKCVVYVPAGKISKIIGKQGKNIDMLEKKIGIGIDVKELTDKEVVGKELAFDTSITKKHVVFYLDELFVGKNIDIFVEGDYLMSANIGKRGVVKINKKTKIARILQDAINMKEEIKVTLKD